MTRIDSELISHAASRGLVRLDTGEVVTLIAWRPHRPPAEDGTRSRRTSMRVCRPGGSPFSLPCRHLAEIVTEATP
jgi:hypothetical protein